MSSVAIIGYGQVGHHFARKLSERYEVTVFSRNPANSFIKSLDEFVPDDFRSIFLCVPDDVVKNVSESFETTHSVVIHTSGSCPLSDLVKHGRRGVIYPIQTFSAGKKINFDALQVLVEATDETTHEIGQLADHLAGEVRWMNSDDRSKIHLAAVFACNFSNHMFLLSEKYLTELGMRFQDIRPLVEETVNKALELNPSKAQTGPAIRKDQRTLSKHVTMIEEDHLKELYTLISESIQKLT